MHVRRLPSGRWRWIVQHAGNRRDGTAPNKALAKLAASQALVELGADHPASVTATVGELLTAWQAERIDGWSPTYADDINTVLERIPETFLNRDIATVDPPIVVALERQLLKAGMSPHRVRRVHGALSAAWKMGVLYGWAHTNPCRDLTGPNVERADIHAPDHTTVAALYAAAPERLRLIVLLAVVTGARLGELVALRWDDLTGNTLTIRRAAVYTPKTGLVIRPKTKTGRKGDRRLELPDGTVAALARHRHTQQNQATERMMPDPVYVFSHDAGATPWRPGYVGLEYRRMRRNVPGAEHVRFHDIRHYVATSMLSDGDSLHDTANQLGHSRETTTADIYAHFLPGTGKAAASRRADRLTVDTRPGETP